MYTVDKTTGCWIWNGFKDRDGYGKARSGNQCVMAHRLVYQQHKGTLSDTLVLDHLCKNRSCVNPSHLEPVSTRENVRRSDRTKLTASSVLEIRGRFYNGESQNKLAREFDVTQSNISKIVHKVSWPEL